MNRTPHRVHSLFLSLAALAPLAAQSAPAMPLPAGPGWRAQRIHKSDGGVWYAHVAQVVEQLGQPEVVCSDDKGRFVVLTVYSGQWTEHTVVPDGLWLAPSRPADVDARVPGRELYAAGRAGSLHQITLRERPFAHFAVESRELAHVAGEEFHAILAADLVRGGNDELLVFGVTGSAYQLLAVGGGGDGDGERDDGSFELVKVAQLPGRVRDVVVLPTASGERVTLLGASRSGHLLRLWLGPRGLEHEVVLHEDCGLGRVALAPERGVAYATRDDGVLLRVGFGDAGVQREAIYAGGQGLRGVAAGRFCADGRESVAVYGYDRRVHLVTRGDDDRWHVETIFAGQQRGHWLAVGEFDGRNGTDELIASGFDGEVVLLARPPGHGLPGAAVPLEERDELRERVLRRWGWSWRGR